MSRIYWVIAVVVGLAFAGLVQAQEQQPTNGEEQTNKEEAESNEVPQPRALITEDGVISLPEDPRSPLRVIIVEDDNTAEARKQREEISDDRQKADLVAQQGMNAATQSIERATWDLRRFTLYSTIAVIIGTALLAFTLYFTRLASKAAVDAVRVTRDFMGHQSRAYLAWDKNCFGEKPSWFLFKGGAVVGRAGVKNFGITPAHDTKYQAFAFSQKTGEELGAASGTLGAIPPSDTVIIEIPCEKPTDKSAIVIKVTITYKTVSGDAVSEFTFRSGVGDNGTIFSDAELYEDRQKID